MDWGNPARMKDSTVSLIARVLEYQERANLDELSCFYRLDVGEFKWEGISFPVKEASIEFGRLHLIEFGRLYIYPDDEDFEISGVSIASCQVVDDFPIPLLRNKPHDRRRTLHRTLQQ